MPERIHPPAELAEIRSRRNEKKATASLPALECKRDEVENVVVILATSRGGSSMLFHLLSLSRNILSLDGEHTHLYKLNGLALSQTGYPSDQVTSGDPRTLAGFWEDMAYELRKGAPHRDAAGATYRDALCLRIFQQWSRLRIGERELSECIDDKLVSLAAVEARYALPLLRDRLLARGHRIMLPYYDGFGACAPETADSSPPTGSACIEEPPFVFPYPRSAPTAAETRTMPIVLKASVDAFKVPLLKAIFPKARIRFIHLTRNPAASINGLRDGWLDRGFYSCDVGAVARLRIGGYSDRFDWGRAWWCFDLPPGWERHTSSSLLEVCAYQWWRSHASILDSIANVPPDDVLRVRFEDVLSEPARAIGRILAFIGLPADMHLERAATTQQPIMATAPPTRFRWKQRYDELRSALESADVSSLASELGYRHDRKDQWL